ncbi:SDR family NAD(P)-dependent oxidoreductase [Thermoleophilia bacterium SCSIO 60948]|nr:SDR family NAD(P)-dependent oxidoreductase [Thermoleophilia bacterium SCSIO 60948]
MSEGSLDGRVALITGGSGGLGAASARALRERGARIALVDIDDEAGERIAAELGGEYFHADVSDPEANEAMFDWAEERLGGADLVMLNAGVASGMGIGPEFDVERYRRVMGINLDGVVFGVHSALPRLRERGGGAIVATASLAGLTAVPYDPLYAANKHAVVGLVRSLGPALAAEGIRVNAVCPGFAETAILSGFRESLVEQGVPIIDPADVAAAVVRLFEGEMSGECWFVQAGRESEAFGFRGIPGPRRADGERAPAADAGA